MQSKDQALEVKVRYETKQDLEVHEIGYSRVIENILCATVIEDISLECSENENTQEEKKHQGVPKYIR